MAIDPFTSLALAGNILQFIDFTWKLLSESRTIYHSDTGSSDDHVVLERIVKNLHPLVANLTISNTASDQLKDIATTCQNVSAQLLEALMKLEMHGQKSRWKSFVHALKNVWEQSQITNLTIQLEKAQNQLNTHLLFMMSDQQSEVLTMIRNLDGDNKQMAMNQMQMIQDLRIELLASIKNCGPRAQVADTTVQDLFQSIRGLKPVNEAAMKKLSQNMTDLSTLISNFAQQSRAVASEQAILKSLRFQAMRLRHSTIVDAHEKTFDWVFEAKASHENDTVAFSNWLESQSGFYWIVGKAGSGKSTLMKFLCKDRRTQKLLQTWADDRKLVMAQFFFWNAGTTMQKSQEGLLQSLLHEVLRQCPGLISQVCSSRWSDYAHYGDEPNVWTRLDLLDVFDNLLQHEGIPAKFCFFIDGLDEYDGDHLELINVFHRWPVSDHFKLCVSSRPWYIFKDAFGQETERYLTLENFTRPDIQLYTRETFNKNKRFKELSDRDSRYNDLVRIIDEKAQGVFLWVFLVVRELLKGFTNADTISMLQKRLEALPPKLEDYFHHMFNQIEEIYKEETVQTFKVALEAREPLPLIIYSLLYDQSDVLSHNAPVNRLKSCEIEFMEDEMKRRLDGRCKGLLEVNKPAYAVVRSKYVVQFLHRTTRDFLLTKDMQFMISKYIRHNFNPRTWLSNTFLYYLKQTSNLSDAGKVVTELLFYCKLAEVHDKILQVDLIGQAEEVFVNLARFGRRNNARDLFTRMVIQGSLLLYTAQKLTLSPTTVHGGNGDSLLHYALTPEWRDFDNEIDPDMVQLLLEYGASPNQRQGETTVWGFLIKSLHEKQLRRDENRSLLRTFDLLLRHGADVDYKIVISEEYRAPRLTGRAADLQKKGETIKTYKGVVEVLREQFGETDAAWLLARAQGPQLPKSQAQVVPKSGFLSFLLSDFTFLHR